MSVRHFFEVAREREMIRIRRESGQPAPWTDDPVFNQYRFCNVFREDDKVTRWVKKHVRDPYDADDRLIPFVTLSRYVNYIPTLSRMFGEIANNQDWTWGSVIDAGYRFEKGDTTVIGGGYMINTPAGYDKLTGAVEIVKHVWDNRLDLAKVASQTKRLQDLHAALKQWDHLGNFMAYEIVTDLRHTSLLSDATDIMTWASWGPGAARGLRWIYEEEFDYTKVKHQERMTELATSILDRTRLYWNLPKLWEMREVEHWLCEYDKYRRAASGQKMKRRFDPHASSQG